MKSFIIKSIIAFILLIVILLCGLFFIPTEKDSPLYTILDRHLQLAKTQSPKIVFVGGSNLGFGLNSQRIEEELQMPVINMGLHAGIGLQFLLKDVAPYINKGDIIVLVPEYDNYFNSVYYGQIALISVLFDVYPEGFKYLSAEQIPKLFPQTIKYAGYKLTKIPQIFSEFNVSSDSSHRSHEIYSKYGYNSYGDMTAHWGKVAPNQIASYSIKKDGKINPEMIKSLVGFKKIVEKKGATLILLPPVFQASSFENIKPLIDSIKTNPTILSITENFDAERYRVGDSLLFDSPNHSNKKGVELRTTHMIEDLKKNKPSASPAF